MKLVYKHKPFSDYERKHLFVFSDNMQYARDNAEKLGLDYAGENITYVDWNHHLESYRDMQLMSECKIIIQAIGKFAMVAGLVGKKVECVIHVSHKNLQILWERQQNASLAES